MATQAKKAQKNSVDVGVMFQQAAAQFRGLNTNEPGQWPPLPKLAVWLLVTIAVVTIAWFLLLTDANDALEAERAREPALKADYRSKLAQDINQAGLGRGLQFDLFRPGAVAVKDYYAELPITIRVSGRYHDIGAFAADIANLSRIVTLHDLNIGPSGAARPDATLLGMDATARTYRYLDEAELAAQRSTKPGAPKK
jgi:type IV pilus assembly protein PilO